MPASRMAACTALTVSSICDCAADLLRQKIARMGDADAQALAAVRRDSRPRPAAAREHGEMRAEHAFGAARHDKRDLLLRLRAVAARDAATAHRTSAATAYSRVKSLTPPLPSVLPSTARIDAGVDLARLDQLACRPDTSPGPLVGMRITSTEIVVACSFRVAAVPEDRSALGPADDVEHGDAGESGGGDRREQRRRFEMRRGNDDEIAEPLRGADELADDRADDGERGRDLQRREQIGQAVGNAQLAEFLRAASRPASRTARGIRRRRPSVP